MPHRDRLRLRPRMDAFERSLHRGEAARFEESPTLGDARLFERSPAHPADERRTPSGGLKLLGVSENNLQEVDVEFPLGVLTAVTCVAGAGKFGSMNPTTRSPAQGCEPSRWSSSRARDPSPTIAQRRVPSPRS